MREIIEYITYKLADKNIPDYNRRFQIEANENIYNEIVKTFKEELTISSKNTYYQNKESAQTFDIIQVYIVGIGWLSFKKSENNEFAIKCI